MLLTSHAGLAHPLDRGPVGVNDNIQWAGFPFTSGYEEWCDLDGTGQNLVCVRKGEQGS